MSKKIESAYESIGPELAEQYLLLNRCNRPVSESRVAEWAEEMKRGDWQVTHQGIAFDTDGNMIDGQHRLLAIIRSGTTQRLMVTYNLAPEAFLVIDDGGARTSKDLFSVRYQKKHGEKPSNADLLTSIAAGMLAGIDGKKVHKEDVSEHTLKHVRLLEDLAPLARQTVIGTCVAAAFANAALFFGKERIMPLVLRLQTEMWSGTTDPLKTLKGRLLRAKLAEHRNDAITKQEKYSYAVAAIRASLNGTSWTKVQATTLDVGRDRDDKKLKAQGVA